MPKIIKLTESDLTRIVKRVIKEENEKNMSSKVEDIINLPKVESKIEDIYSNLSEKQKENLRMVLDNLGVDENSSASEVHSSIVSAVEDRIGGEMSEEDEDESPKHKAAKILHGIGAGNIAAWGGVPAAIGIGALLAGTVGAPMVAGFAISWGATALLMGLAKLLAGDEKVEGVNENHRRRQYRRR